MLTSRRLMPLLKIPIFSWLTVLRFLSVVHKKCLKQNTVKTQVPFLV